MKKIYTQHHFPSGKWRKILFVMRIKLVLLLCCMSSMYANTSFSQQPKFDVHYNNSTIASVLEDLKAKTGYTFVHKKNEISGDVRITANIENTTLEQVLEKVLTANGYEFSIEGKIIAVNKARAVQQPQASGGRVVGIVSDSQGAPMVGVSVLVKGTNRGVATGADGRYDIIVSSGATIVYSFIGKKTAEIKYEGQPYIHITMEDDVSEIGQVVITGMFNRRLESETGSSVQFTREQLLEVGNKNVLKSLANLDPSFMIMESLEFGSDPNRMPTVQMRGQSSFPDLQGEYKGNPNQPLFILDGFEVGVEKVYDLDMNRVSSITILKDASAKAIYGSKAGNGVVVIELVRPKMGEMRVSYSGTLDIEAPDLTGYNLMNASEKLAFEKGRGLYNAGSAAEQHIMDHEYEALLRNVLSGVDTYWLSKPLRVGVGHKHSLNLHGGDDRILYGIGLNYSNVIGVMKGSERNTFSGNMNFSYTYNNLIFRNTLELTINNADNSPYGNFSEYTKLNPYWIPYDENGDPTVVLGKYNGSDYYNPLYNASLNTKNSSAYTEIRNNSQMEWKILTNLRATGRFSFTRNVGDSDLFYPANHTMFIGYGENESNRKGRYTKGESESTAYQADFGLSYSLMLDKHMIFANAVWNMSSSSSTGHTYAAEGFGNDTVDDIAFGAQYLTGSTPSGSSASQREIGIIGSLNYSYDDRYLFDASARTTGSSMYGADDKWGLFWSLGLGWNIQKEAFVKDAKWLDRLKIRGSVGYTGSQNFDPFQAKARYEYAQKVYDGGYGAIILGLPNDKLRWQRVLDYNIGADMSLWSRVTLKFDYFVSVTDDLLLDVSLPPSTGFSTYKENLGKVENTGFDVSLSLQLWRNQQKRGWATLTVSGMHNKNKIKEISNTFEHRNNQQNTDKETAVVDFRDLDAIRQAYTAPRRSSMKASR